MSIHDYDDHNKTSNKKHIMIYNACISMTEILATTQLAPSVSGAALVPIEEEATEARTSMEIYQRLILDDNCT